MITYTPQKGDIIWLNFDPQAGKEIQKIRPAIVLSSTKFNKYSDFIWICPITSTINGFPGEIVFNFKDQKGKEYGGAVLVSQIKSVDWKERKAKFISKCDKNTLNSTLDAVVAILVG